MRKLYTLILPVLLFYSFQITAQNKAWNTWCFGYGAELSFNSGVPVLVNGCVISTGEGSASISDSATGQLLFYTDGTSVWNRNNEIMPSNTIPLGGNTSTTQSALIVPMPGSSTRYYLFTADDQAGLYGGTGDSGVSMSIIDMSLQGGLGDVAQQPQEIISPTCEKLTGCHMANGNGYWVVTHLFASNAFYAIPITATGLGTPVISYQGTNIIDYSDEGFEAIGYMKTSPDNSKIATATWNAINQVQLFNFDNATGVVSAPVFTDSFPNAGYYAGPYGLSFSPNSELLYIGIVNTATIYQYNLLAGNDSAIVASKYFLTCSDEDAGALQIAPDGKIYVTNGQESGTLDCISSPNIFGAGCNYIDAAVSLGSNYAAIGLPNCIDNLFLVDTVPPLRVSITSTNVPCSNVCNGTAVVNVQSGPAPYTYNWQPGGLTTASIDSLCAGTYNVVVTDSAGSTVTDSAVITAGASPTVIASTPLDTFCPGDSTQICATTGFVLYNWGNSDTSTCIYTGLAGMYAVTVTDSVGCTASSNPINITVLSPPPVDLNISGDTLRAFGAATYQWYYDDSLLAGSTDSVLVAIRPGLYYVVVSDSNGCLIMSNNELISAIASLKEEMPLKIYPDPAVNELDISYVLNSATALQISITDITGRRIANVVSEKEASGNYVQHVDIHQLASAVYILNLTSESGSINLRFVKE